MVLVPRQWTLLLSLSSSSSSLPSPPALATAKDARDGAPFPGLAQVDFLDGKEDDADNDDEADRPSSREDRAAPGLGGARAKPG
jgi:hypothetical protein